MNMPDFQGLKDYMFNDFFLNRISPEYLFHREYHPKRALDAVEIIAEREGIKDEHDLCYLKTGAIMHDSGYSRTRKGHERCGVELDHEILPGFGYSDEDIKAVDIIVLVTELSEKPETILEKIMCDADTYDFGTDEFLKGADLLKQERGIGNDSKSLHIWYTQLLEEMRGHQYYTQAAKALLDEDKQKNIEKLERMRDGLGISSEIDV